MPCVSGSLAAVKPGKVSVHGGSLVGVLTAPQKY
jgi:hypothetical protein